MTGVSVSAEGPSAPWFILNRAAVELGEMASKATNGPWRRHDTHLPFGGYTATVLAGEGNDVQLLAWLPTMSNEPWDHARNAWNNSIWMAAMDPDMAGPLVDWLLAEARFVRRNYTAMHGQVEHLPSLRFARQVLGETS